MAIALESHRSSLRVRVDPHDNHHHQDHHRHHHASHHQSHHHWWHWRHKKHSADDEQPQQQQSKPHPRRVHHHHQHRTAEAPKPSALSKRLSSATVCHDDPHSAQGRRKRIVLHAIFKC